MYHAGLRSSLLAPCSCSLLVFVWQRGPVLCRTPATRQNCKQSCVVLRLCVPVYINRLAILYHDWLGVKKLLARAKTICEAGGDWEHKNKLKVRRGRGLQWRLLGHLHLRACLHLCEAMALQQRPAAQLRKESTHRMY